MHSLQNALGKCGWSVKENQKARTYPSDPERNTVHQYVGVNPMTNGYDVGFNVNADTKEIIATCDWFGGTIAASLGRDFTELKKKYVMATAEEAGFDEQTILEQFADGSLILEVDDGN